MSRFIWACFFLFIMHAGFSQDASEPQASSFELSREELVKTWQVRDRIHAKGTDTLAANQLDRMLQLKGDLGLDAIPEITSFLLEEVKNDKDETPSGIASKLDYAEKFSPSSADVDLAMCGTWNTESISRCWKGIQRNYATFDGKLAWISNLSIALVLSLLTLLALFTLIVSMSHLDSIPNLLLHLVPTLSKRSASALTGLSVIMMYFAFGLLGGIAVIGVIIWHKLHSVQKITLGVLILLVASIPLILIAPALKTNFDTSSVPLLEKATSKLNILENKDILEKWSASHSDDIFSMFNLARIEYKLGNFEKAKRLYTNIDAIKPNWDKSMHNLALTYYRMGEIEKADSILRDVMSRLKSWKLYYNLGQIALSQTKLDEGRELLQKARELNPEALIQGQQTTSSGEKKLQLVDETLSYSDLSTLVWNKTSALKKAQNTLHPYFFPRLPIPRFWLFLLMTLLLAIWTDFIKIKDLSKRSDKSAKPKSFDVFDPNASILEDNQYSNFKSFSKPFLNRWIGLFIPGAHYFSCNRPIKGLLVSLPFMLCAYLFISNTSWIVPFPTSIAPLCVAIMTISFATSAISVIMSSDS